MSLIYNRGNVVLVYITTTTENECPEFTCMEGKPTRSFKEAVDVCKEIIIDSMNEANITPIRVSQVSDTEWELQDEADTNDKIYYINAYEI